MYEGLRGVELRWYSNGNKIVLQYRTMIARIAYAYTVPDTGYSADWVWTDWMDVPTVEGERV